MTVTAKKKSRAPAKVPAPKQTKLPAKEPVAPKPEAETPKPSEQKTVLVEPLSGPAFQLTMQIIDSADFKGRDVNQVIAVKMELARVAGLRTDPGNGQ